jgi:MSHA biogenesis protein MshQ
LQQNSASINNDWGQGSPVPGVINDDGFSVRWEGFIVPGETGDYRFRTNTDDGVRLWVDNLGSPIIDEWQDQSPTPHDSGVITLEEGQPYAIRMEMYENQGGAVAQLLWQVPDSGGFSIVPASVLFTCPEGLGEVDHFRITSVAEAVTCSPAPVTIQASNDDGEPITDYTGTIDLSTTTGRGDWLADGSVAGTLVRGGGDSGNASYTFAEADAGVVTLSLSHTLAALVNTNVFDSDAEVGELAGFDPDILFTESGFIFHEAGNLGAPIGPQIAGKNSSVNPGALGLRLTAVRTDDNTGACEAFLEGPQNVEVGYVCDDPASCVLNDALEVNGVTVASNDAGNDTNTSTVKMDFGDDTTSSAIITLLYRDAGRLSLFARLALEDADGQPTGEELAGGSNAFVSVPAGFCVAATAATAECTGDPAECSVLTTAGSDFDVEYRAVAWENPGETGSDFCSGNDLTPGFSAAGLALEHSLVAPAPGTGEAGRFSPEQVSFAPADQAATTLAHRISEVGVFRVQLMPGQPYLGELLPGGESADIGRFTPAYFETSVSDPGELAPACGVSPGGFVYTGQDTGWLMEPEIGIIARNQQDEVTTNYTRGGFRKLSAADVERGIPDTDSVQTEADSADLLDLTFTEQAGALTPVSGSPGEMTYRFASDDSLIYPKTPASLLAPFDPRLTFDVARVRDSDGIESDALPLSFSPAADFQIRYGRLTMDNAFGPETAPELFMGFRAEYWDGSRFVLNGDDSCYTWNTTDINNTENHHSLTAASGTLTDGQGDDLQLVPDSRGTDTLSWSVPIWLQADWDNDGELEDPSATAIFGVYRGHDRVIDWRER